MALVRLPSGKCINTDVPLFILGNVISHTIDNGFQKNTEIFISITTMNNKSIQLVYDTLEAANADYDALFELYAVQDH